MRTFKVGDVVRYVRPGILGWESVDWAEMAGCILGEKYTVVYIDDDWCRVFSSVPNRILRYDIHPEHFELAEHTTTYKPNCIQMPSKRRIKNA